MLKKLIIAGSLITLSTLSFAQISITAPAISMTTSPNIVKSASLVANKDFIPLQIDSSKVLVAPENGKPLVIEFFWYGCSHCYHMEPFIKRLIVERKGDFTFKRYPVVFPRWESGAQLYFTIEEMGLVEKLHDKIFYTVQEKKLNILDDKNLREQFLKQEGVDIIKFNNVYNSFSINSKMAKAKTYVPIYKLDSSPSFAINNKYLVNPGLSKTYENTIKSVDILLSYGKK